MNFHSTSIVALMQNQVLANLLFLLLLTSILTTGCREKGPNSKPDPTASSSSVDTEKQEEEPEEPLPDPVAFEQTFEVNAEDLLSAALAPELLEQGWVRIFDGQSPFGWFVVETKADWRVNDGIISVTRGDKSYLCSSFQVADFELELEFRCDKDTNSGIFLRTTPQPESVAQDCLELNIAPPDNPFPTGSFVQREKLEPAELGEFDPTQWHKYFVRVEGQSAQVKLDGKLIMELENFEAAPIGHISLQHNSGKVEFRNVLLRPLDGELLSTDKEWESDWELSTKEEAEVTVEVRENGLEVNGGLGQLQSKEDYQDFFLQASYTLATPEVNSGIFFRCIRDNMLDGYECQVNHAIEGNDRLRPADAGAGAIFRRENARIVMGDGTTKTYLTLLAQGPQFVTWVNGVQVAEFYDSREPNENPRRGLRLEAGPLSVQAHDPGTSFTLHELEVRTIAP